MPYKDPEKQRKYQREWQRKNREKYKRYWRKIRKQVIDLLGGKCVYCGCDYYPALEINHIKGDSNKETTKRRKSFHLDILAGRRKTDDLEVVCSICNRWHYIVKLKGLPDRWEIKWKGYPLPLPVA